MAVCRFTTSDDDGTYDCPRDAHEEFERCPFHLSPSERRSAGVDEETLRAAFLADVSADPPARREYVGVELAGLDLSAAVVDGHGVDRITFRDSTITGTMDLSGAVVRHPLHVEDCRIGRLDATGATTEREVTVVESTLGGEDGPVTPLDCRRANLGRGLTLRATEVVGSVEFAACRVEGWLTVDGCEVAGGGHLSGATLDVAQMVDTVVGRDIDARETTADRLVFERLGTESVDLSACEVGSLAVGPDDSVECRMTSASVAGGRLDQPDDGVALYDCTDATVGDVAIECTPETFDRYRFYRTTFDGFPFARYRSLLRATRWRLHEYAGDPDEPADTEGLEITYLQAKQAASRLGDSGTTSRFFVRELRWRRHRYAEHFAAADHSLRHRVGAGSRWATNGFLDLVANYGERPGRVAGVSAVLVAACAAAYPALGGLDTGDGTATYAAEGVGAVVDGLYFSVVTFATLGLGDVRPVGDVARILAASEAVAGAFLTALFVFSLGRRVAR
jgi:hypothetical protein